MIEIIKGLLWLLIIPEIIGLGIIRFSKKENISMLFAYVLGHIFGFALFELLAIPMTFAKFQYTTLAYSWMVIEIILAIISLKVNWYDLGDIIGDNIMDVLDLPKLLNIIFLLLIFLQCYVGFAYMHEDYDDSNFLGKATIAIDTNSLYKYDDIGYEYTSFPSRHVFSPFPIYTATLSTAIGVHPLILAKTFFPIVFISMAYMIYAMIADVLFKEDKQKTLIFLIILSLLYIWGAYSNYTNFVFLLYRIWQGKAILANIILPFIWLIFLKYINKDVKFFGWFILLLTLWGADLLSSMALSLASLSTVILTFIWTIKDKKISYIFKTVICFIPSIIYGAMYLMIR